MIQTVTWEQIDHGDEICVWRGSSGQSGTWTMSYADGIQLMTPGGPMQFLWEEITEVTVDKPGKPEECLNFGDKCSGPVEMWYSGGLNGRSWPRCTYHGEKRLKDREGSIEVYADSDVPPPWFDPSTGERWEDD